MDYISENIVKEILKTKDDGRLFKRESHTLEFKQDFDWDIRRSRIKYIKSIAAFANRTGGYMVFGISNNPREIIGMQKSFSDIDDAEITQFISLYLANTPNYEREEFIINGNKIGVIYVHEADKKPIICIKDYGDIITESSIYYRYYSRSCVIKASDLIHLIHESKEKETHKWMNLFSQIAKVGVHEVGIYNAKSGEITTEHGNRFILDDDLLKRLKVLDKYSLHEKGSEAVRIIGEIDQKGTVIYRPYVIQLEDIIERFLEDSDVEAPQEYLEALCYQNTGILPIYFYLNKAGLSVEDGIQHFAKMKINTQSKNKLISRLRNEKILLNAKNKHRIDTETAVGERRKFYYDALINNNEVEVDSVGKAKRYLEALMNLEQGEYNSLSVKSLLNQFFDQYYDKLSYQLRQAIAYIDLIENRE